MDGSAVPTFYLYGEPHRRVEDGFVHVERLDDRSRPSEWTIQAHAHADLHHLFLIAEGGGETMFEIARQGFAAPALLVVPATVVHGFAWTSESRGWVLTASRAYLNRMAAGDGDLASLFRAARTVPLSPEDAAAVDARMGALQRELGWALPGHDGAVRAAILDLWVLALRRSRAGHGAPAAPPGRRAALVARYRERIEARFRQREPVAVHAAALGVGESALRRACIDVAARSPGAMLDDRAFLEAQRALLYSNLSVAQIGYSLGFGDPAYFSRFFARRAGCSPRAFRAAASAASANVLALDR